MKYYIRSLKNIKLRALKAIMITMQADIVDPNKTVYHFGHNMNKAKRIYPNGYAMQLSQILKLKTK